MIQGAASAIATCLPTDIFADRRRCQDEIKRRTMDSGSKLIFEVDADNKNTESIAAYTDGDIVLSKRSRLQKAMIAAVIAKSPIACAPPVTCTDRRVNSDAQSPNPE